MESAIGDDAGRNAYLAVFHAAQAYVFEVSNKVTKTHAGLRAEFSRLAKDDPRIDRFYITFLAQAYSLKEIADYELGPGSSIPIDRAGEALENAERFVGCVLNRFS